MIAKNPPIVAHLIETIDHDLPFGLITRNCALIDVSNIKEQVIWALLSPLPNLGRAAS